ncbi:flagellar motor switch protein FliM [Oerskovia sp. NPDC056781]|uniref:flagellar motor switch protein FliM n=1 Tax=Oerskovia sp. NPDC056781 TaxID=3345942 RepID=UPI00366E0134
MSTTTPVRVQGPAERRKVEVYDFRRPTTLVREHHRILEMAFESFARQWGTQLTARVRVVSQVSLAAVTMRTYDDYVADLPVTTAVVVCEIDGVSPRAVLQFPHTDALTWIAHMLGAGPYIPAIDRKFTDVERALVTSLVTETLRDLRHSMGRLLETPLKIGSIQHNSQFVQAAPTAELMIVAEFNLRVGDGPCTATLALPATALLPHLGEANPADDPADAAARTRRHLARSLVDVTVELSSAVMTPVEVVELAVGDVVRLPHNRSRPLDVIVDGHVLARGAVGSSGSRLACRIVTTEEN